MITLKNSMKRTIEFGSLIKRARKERGLSQQELANKVGIDFTFISKMENGYMLPSEDNMEKIAELLGLDIDIVYASAGKLSNEIAEIVKANPEIIKTLLQYKKK